VKDDTLYLHHIRDALDAIKDYTVGGEEAFYQTRMIQDAVIRNLEIIGEATKNLSPALRENHPHTPWKQIAGLRDILIHQYFGVDLKLVWTVVQVRLPALRDQTDQILNTSFPKDG